MDNHDSSKNIKVAFFLNLGFTIFEFIGGYLTNSVANDQMAFD
jgi:cobalt-zinc-cadmium efflux system protein